MYEASFGFNDRPFVTAPIVERYYPAGSIEHARQNLARCIERAEGPGLLIGPSGTGKTLVCHLLAEQFSDTFEVVMLASARLCTRRALLQNILFALDLPYRGLDEGELRLSLMDHLEPCAERENGLLLLVDEANTLPMRLLEETRMLTNMVRDGRPRVQLVLAGGPALEERFANPKLDSFNQRIAARCYLQSMNRDETFQYVRSQIAAAGGEPDAIADEAALRAVYHASGGIPRLINQVCDHALWMAHEANRQQLDGAMVEQAWADLQQLPAPWQTGDQPPAEDASGVIEFGELDRPDSEDDDDGGNTVVEDLLRIGGSAVEWEPLSSGGHVAAGATCNEPVQFDSAIVDADESASAASPVAPPSADPFEDSFENEEIVIDHYAILDAELLAERPHVSSAEGRELAAAISHAARIGEQQQPDEHVTTEPAPGETIHAEPAGRPDSDQLAEAGIRHFDDPDRIVIEHGAEPALPQPKNTPARARRREFRQLFTQLRRG